MKYLEAHREVMLLAHKIFDNDKECNGLDMNAELLVLIDEVYDKNSN